MGESGAARNMTLLGLMAEDAFSIREVLNTLLASAEEVDEQLLTALSQQLLERGARSWEAGARVAIIGLHAALLFGHVRLEEAFLEFILQANYRKVDPIRMVGDGPSLEEMLAQALERMWPRLRQAEEETIFRFSRMSIMLVDRLFALEDFSQARQIAVRSLHASQELQFRFGQVWSSLKALETCRFVEDIVSSLEYASALLESLLAAEQESIPEGELPPREQASALVLDLAVRCYYQRRDFASAERLARIACALNPGSAPSHYLLGVVLLVQQRAGEALNIWRRVVSLRADFPGDHANLASTLAQLGQLEEAVEVMAVPITLRPREAWYYMIRGRWRAKLNRHVEAIADFTQAMILARSVEFEGHFISAGAREISPEEVFLQSWLGKIGSYEKLGEVEAVEAEVRGLLEHPEAVLRAQGHAFRGSVYQRTGRQEEALAAYNETLREDPGEDGVRLRRADLLMVVGRWEAALEDLALLSPSNRLPLEAASRLRQVVSANPDYASAHRWLGFALLQDFRLSEAQEALTRALQLEPGHSTALRWRGMSKAFVSPEELPSISQAERLMRLMGGLDDLCQALQIDPADEESRHAALWLIDRMFLSTMHREILLEASQIQSVFPGISQLRSVLHQVSKYPELREWRPYLVALDRARQIATNLELPVFAMSMHIRMAEAHLMLNEFQQALSHLDVQEELAVLIGTPLSKNLQQMHEQQIKQDRYASVRKRTLFELEVFDVYGFSSEVLREGQLIRAIVLSRMGAIKESLNSLGPVEKYLQMAREGRLPLMHGVTAARVLRDGERVAEALELLDALREAKKEEADRSLAFVTTRGTVLMRAGRIREGVDVLQKSITLDPAHPWLQQLNIASGFYMLGDPESCLKALGQIDPRAGFLSSSYELFNYYRLQAAAEADLGHIGPAREHLQESIRYAEEIRHTLRSFHQRLSWMESGGSTYELAVRLALEEGHGVEAFDLAEQIRGRVLVDQLALGSIALPPEADAIVATQQRFQKLLRILEALQKSLPSTLDPKLVLQLNEFDPKMGVIDQTPDGLSILRPPALEKKVDEVQNWLRKLEEQLEGVRFAASEALFGPVISWDGLRQFLEALTSPVVVATFFVMQTSTALFIARPGSMLPVVLTFRLGSEALHETVSHTVGRDQGARLKVDIDGLQWTFREMVEAISAHTQPGERLCLVPHNILHSVPFHALQADGRLLGERNPTWYAPSASVLRLCLGRGGRRRRRAVVLGDSRGDLPHAREEAAVVAERFGTSAYLGSDATRSALLGALTSGEEPVEVLHLACHGFFEESDALASGIALAPEEAPPGIQGRKPGDLLARDVLSLRIEADLVVLSACETGLNELRSGDELMGLTRAFLVAGAASVIVTLWAVDDLSGSLLMSRFYEVLLSGQSGKAEALQEAQRYVRELTVQQAVAHCDARLAMTREPRRVFHLTCDRARLNALAGDLPAALQSYRRASMLAAQGGTGVAMATANIEATLEKLNLKLRQAPPAMDYMRRPFDSHLYWAPFVLVGDQS